MTDGIVKSNCQIIHESYMHHEIGLDEARTLHAMATVDILDQYPVRIYSPMAKELRLYVEQRNLDLIERDPLMASLNGDWLREVRVSGAQNLLDAQTLQQDRDLCLKALSVENAQTINNQLNKFISNHFPLDDFSRASRVQIKDMDDARRSL